MAGDASSDVLQMIDQHLSHCDACKDALEELLHYGIPDESDVSSAEIITQCGHLTPIVFDNSIPAGTCAWIMYVHGSGEHEVRLSLLFEKNHYKAGLTMTPPIDASQWASFAIVLSSRDAGLIWTLMFTDDVMELDHEFDPAIKLDEWHATPFLSKQRPRWLSLVAYSEVGNIIELPRDAGKSLRLELSYAGELSNAALNAFLKETIYDLAGRPVSLVRLNEQAQAVPMTTNELSGKVYSVHGYELGTWKATLEHGHLTFETFSEFHFTH